MIKSHLPSVSSGQKSAFGILHLRRLWQKLSLDAAGKLARGYDACGKGFDQMLLDGLGLDRTEVIQFVRTGRPSFVEFEEWVAGHGTVTDEAIAKVNEAIAGYEHTDETRKAILAAAGISDDGDAPRDAATLNEIDDANTFEARILKPHFRKGRRTTIIAEQPPGTFRDEATGAISKPSDKLPHGEFASGRKIVKRHHEMAEARTWSKFRLARETPSEGSLAAPVEQRAAAE